MPDRRARAALPLARCGAIAREILADDGESEVIAVFERSFYLACPRGLVCIGIEIGAGPINVELAPAALGERHPSWLDLGAFPEAKGATAGGVAVIGDGLAIDVTSGVTWQPPPLPPFVRATVAASLGRLKATARDAAPVEGLARLVLSPADAATTATPVSRAAAAPVRDLARELPRTINRATWSPDAVRAATLLVGLGPGFTPSGDDLLGGVMLALGAAGLAPLRDSLWQALEPELGHLTTPASAMHLSAAADGMAAAAMHALLAAILAGAADLPDDVARVGRIGHTSGWDTLAGIVLGLEAVLGAAAA
jgi:hypothetical protein